MTGVPFTDGSEGRPTPKKPVAVYARSLPERLRLAWWVLTTGAPERLDVTAGYVVVPKTPTRKMLNAAAAALSPGKRPRRWLSVREKHAHRYRAMIDAAQG